MSVLVTGGAGFIGSNLADRLAREGNDVVVYDSLARPGVEANLAWLQRNHPARITATIADIRDTDRLTAAVAQAGAVFHLAGQVAVTTSLADPQEDFDINLRGTFTLLEAVRRHGVNIPIVFASTNKVYGDLQDIELALYDTGYAPADDVLHTRGIGESYPLDFHTPYGCSKGAADQYVLDYARSFGVPAAVLRMSCIYGQRQMGTEDQGWVAHFMIRAMRGEPISIFGDGHQVRDILHVSDAVSAYLAVWRRMEAARGCVFNLGGGPANAVSLRMVLSAIGGIARRPIETRYSDWRPGDQRYYVSDTRRATKILGLAPPMPWQAGLASLAQWLNEAALPPRQREALAV